jgi:catechol 2,3-dioxygenase-like lactoylglutathione lyase family enzyme
VSNSDRVSRRELIGASAALGALTLAPNAAMAANGLDISRLVRTALFVSSLDRSLGFYRDLLGLDQIFFQGEFTGPVLGRLLGIPADMKVRASILKAEGPAFGMIGLFEVGGKKRPRVRKRRGTVNVGESVLVFYMPKLDPLLERLRAGGFDIVSPPVNLTPRFREMMFYGPDDQLINVIEQEHRAL